MARRFVLRDLEQQYGDLHEVIPRLVNERGQKGAADFLNTTQATISRWLKDNGYTLNTEWVKEAEPQS